MTSRPEDRAEHILRSLPLLSLHWDIVLLESSPREPRQEEELQQIIERLKRVTNQTLQEAKKALSEESEIPYAAREHALEQVCRKRMRPKRWRRVLLRDRGTKRPIEIIVGDEAFRWELEEWQQAVRDVHDRQQAYVSKHRELKCQEQPDLQRRTNNASDQSENARAEERVSRLQHWTARLGFATAAIGALSTPLGGVATVHDSPQPTTVHIVMAQQVEEARAMLPDYLKELLQGGGIDKDLSMLSRLGTAQLLNSDEFETADRVLRASVFGSHNN